MLCAHYYRITGYFCGVLIFVIFVVNPSVTKFSTHKIFPPTLQLCLHCSSVYTAALSTRANVFGPGDVFIALFRYLCPADSALDSYGPLSQAVPCVVMEEVNKAEAQPKNGASTSSSGMRAPTDFVLCRSSSLSRKTRHWSAPSFLYILFRQESGYAFLVETVPSSKFTLREPQNLKPWNLILRASSSFSRKFPPTKITRYTVLTPACGGTPLNRHLSTADTHDITDKSQLCFHSLQYLRNSRTTSHYISGCFCCPNCSIFCQLANCWFPVIEGFHCIHTILCTILLL